MVTTHSATWLSNATTVISYLPIALYAESLRFNSSIIQSICSSTAIPLPLTGCVKDFSRIWQLRPLDVLSDFQQHRGSSVASVRHGNTFPLANKAILDRAKITGRRDGDGDEVDGVYRATRLHVTYIVPGTATTTDKRKKMVVFSCGVRVVELAVLLCVAGVCFRHGLFAGGALVTCLAVNTILTSLLQRLTSVAFAHRASIESDAGKNAAGGAPLDVQVVADDWNASDIDVLVGYDRQLHALTNLRASVKNWKAVVWITRCIGVLLIVQASFLASLLGLGTKQAWGSPIWLACYALLFGVSALFSRVNPEMLLEGSMPCKITRLPPIVFGGRRPALVFIGMIPGLERKFGVHHWGWMDPFMPNNKRRDEWLSQVVAAGMALFDGGGTAAENGRSWVSEKYRWIYDEMQKARKMTSFQTANDEFLKDVGLKPRTEAPRTDYEAGLELEIMR